jgi:hypothetical protein
MNGDTRKKLLSTYAQIRHGLEKSQKLIAALEPATLGDDGEAVKAAMLERFAQQIEQLNYLEARLSRIDRT